MKQLKVIVATVLALATAVVLVACGGGASGSSSASSSNASASASASSTAAAALAGKPWVTSVVQGNLPAQQPKATDDLYTHYAYDYLAAHQEQPSSLMGDYAPELMATCLSTIKDSSKSGHDLDQLRIFFNQAADTATLQKTGMADVQPYLDRINAVSSIKEMNELLVADDFPFSPFLMTAFSLNDTRDVNIVAVVPNLVLVDPLLVGGMLYQESNDPETQANMDRALMTQGSNAILDLAVTGMSSEDVQAAFDKIAAFEKAYGKYLDYNGKYSTQDFGAAANAARESYISLDDLCASCPNFPMKAVLDKLGKGGSPLYSTAPGWTAAFNELWKDENIDVIKEMATLKVLNETRPYRDPSALNQLLGQSGEAVDDADTFAYKACDSMDTLAVVLANTYVNEALGTNAKGRLTTLSQDLVNAYKDLVGKTPWIGEESRARVLEKLDHMTLNVLEPAGTYYDFSGLELTPTDQGGTLMGNYLKLKQHRLDQESKLVGQPAIAACPWFSIKPTTMNCFYDATSNSINILPGFVTSLYYADGMDETSLLAGIGFTIGHEISHGFDYAGAQYDAYGSPNPVFADADVNAFVQKASTLAAYYNGIEIAPGVTVNGENVVTEAAADLCGMQAVLEIAGKTQDTDYEELFASFASTWSQVVSEQMLPTLLIDTHTLNNQRVNVNAQMFDPIYEKLGVKAGDTMYLAPEERINVWGPNA